MIASFRQVIVENVIVKKTTRNSLPTKLNRITVPMRTIFMYKDNPQFNSTKIRRQTHL